MGKKAIFTACLLTIAVVLAAFLVYLKRNQRRGVSHDYLQTNAKNSYNYNYGTNNYFKKRFPKSGGKT